MTEKVYARNKASGIVVQVPDWYMTRAPYAGLYEEASPEDYACATCGVPGSSVTQPTPDEEDDSLMTDEEDTPSPEAD